MIEAAHLNPATFPHIDDEQIKDTNPSIDEAVQTSPTLDQQTTDVARKSLSFNLAYEIVMLGQKKERQYHTLLHRYTDEANEIQEEMRELIDLNGKLVNTGKEVTLSDDVIQLAKKLEKSGIALLQKDEKKLTPERMTEIKAQIQSHSDRLKTKLQTQFTTKIQVTINEINSLNEAIKMIIKYNDRVIEIILGRQGKQ